MLFFFFQVFFAALPAVQAKFEEARQSPTAREVPPEQLENMALRLKVIGPKAAQRRIKLKFLEHKVSSNYSISSVLVIFCLNSQVEFE